jgi:hypothetical protein
MVRRNIEGKSDNPRYFVVPVAKGDDDMDTPVKSSAAVKIYKNLFQRNFKRFDSISKANRCTYLPLKPQKL